MKTVNKIILCSCIFCYLLGIWFIGSRFGLVKLISRYGLAEAFDRIPKDFPQFKYLYYGLAAYTLLYILVVWLIYRVIARQGKEQAQLQQEASEVTEYAEQMNSLLAQYNRYANVNRVSDNSIYRKLQALQRQIAALPPAVVRNAAMKSDLSAIVIQLRNILTDDCAEELFSNAIDKARDEVDALKRKSVTIKQ